MKKFRVTNGIKGLCEIKVNYINTVTIMKWECPVIYTIEQLATMEPDIPSFKHMR